MKCAACPVMWGVSDVPDWCSQLPPDRVLADMRTLGIHATEAGPPGYLPADPTATRALLDSYGLRLIGGFVTAVLHDRVRRAQELASVTRHADRLASAGARLLGPAAATR